MKGSQLLLAVISFVVVTVTLLFNLRFLSVGVDLPSPLLDATRDFKVSRKKDSNRPIRKKGSRGHKNHRTDSHDVIARAVDRQQAAEAANRHNANESLREIEILWKPHEIQWMRKRRKIFQNGFQSVRKKSRRESIKRASLKDPDRMKVNETNGLLKYQIDKDGPWLDFIIAGHPKTGTTSLVANLANAAPMKIKDFCIKQIDGYIHFVYEKWMKDDPAIQEWPDKYIPDRNLQLRGVKCPRFVADSEMLLDVGYYPRTKLIIGVRHPVLWFTSFHNMGHVGNLYRLMEICPHYANIDPITGIPSQPQNLSKYEREICIAECRCGLPVCFHRSRLHLSLAKIGKTPLSPEERMLLAPEDPDGGMDLFNGRLQNPIFVYDQTQMKEPRYWDQIASFLGISHVPNAHYKPAHGKNHNKTLCIPLYDEFRAKIMAHSYNMSVWMEDYFLPLAEDPLRPDVVVANATSLRIILQTYKEDPCKRLIRNEADGTYNLDPALGSSGYTVYSNKIGSCPATFPLTPEEKEAKKKAQEAKQTQRQKLG